MKDSGRFFLDFCDPKNYFSQKKNEKNVFVMFFFLMFRFFFRIFTTEREGQREIDSQKQGIGPHLHQKQPFHHK